MFCFSYRGKNRSDIPRGRMASLACCTTSSFLLLLLLLLLTCVLADDVAKTTLNVFDDVGEETTEDSLAEEMRDQAMDVDVTMRKTLKNTTSTEAPFMPSVHLGPIASSDQQRQTTKLSPFNVGPLLFPDEHKKSPFNSLSAIKFGESKGIPPTKPTNPPKLEKLPQLSFRPSEKDENLVKSIDDKQHSKEDCSPAPKINTNKRQGEPVYHQHVAYLAEPSLSSQSSGSYSEESYDNGHQQQYVNYETKPTKYDATPVVYGTPYHHQQAAVVQPAQAAHFEPNYHHNEAPAIKPDMIINFQHPMAFQAASYDTKPKTVIYVSQEPHQYYHQPPVINHLETPEHEHEETYPIYYDQPQYKSMSPWKKILHIVGAFLPLGLLFALLPNVLKPNTNPNNNPSIVLSKLRVNDLTPEHKRDQLALDTECREERSICRLLSAADNAGFDFLRNLVQRIAEKTADPSVRKKELDRIFEAAKLGNCDILTCDFYDGT